MVIAEIWMIQGIRVLMYAAGRDDLNIVQLLVEKGADVNEQVSNDQNMMNYFMNNNANCRNMQFTVCK